MKSLKTKIVQHLKEKQTLVSLTNKDDMHESLSDIVNCLSELKRFGCISTAWKLSGTIYKLKQ